jgi:hypothetical protein
LKERGASRQRIRSTMLSLTMARRGSPFSITRATRTTFPAALPTAAAERRIVGRSLPPWERQDQRVQQDRLEQREPRVQQARLVLLVRREPPELPVIREQPVSLEQREPRDQPARLVLLVQRDRPVVPVCRVCPEERSRFSILSARPRPTPIPAAATSASATRHRIPRPRSGPICSMPARQTGPPSSTLSMPVLLRSKDKYDFQKPRIKPNGSRSI